jgi:hypothetical protein
MVILKQGLYVKYVMMVADWWWPSEVLESLWPNWGTNLAFAWGNWAKPQKTSGQSMFQLTIKLGTPPPSKLQVYSIISMPSYSVSPYQQAKSHSSSQEISHHSQNPKIHYNVHSSLSYPHPDASCLSTWVEKASSYQVIPVHITHLIHSVYPLMSNSF